MVYASHASEVLIKISFCCNDSASSNCQQNIINIHEKYHKDLRSGIPRQSGICNARSVAVGGE